jgi:hypothetical protein
VFQEKIMGAYGSLEIPSVSKHNASYEKYNSTLVTGSGKITCPRCTAMSKRSGQKCKKTTLKNSRTQKCDFHGGRSTGPKTEAIKARIAAAHTVHRRKTREQRAERSAASVRISRLEGATHVLKMTTAPRSRGRKAADYTPISSVEGVRQMLIDDFSHRNTGVKD